MLNRWSVTSGVLGLVGVISGEELCEPRLGPGEPAGLEVLDNVLDQESCAVRMAFAVFLLEQEKSWELGIFL
jgi:hypothetical protein